MAQSEGIPTRNGETLNSEMLLAIISSLQGLTLALQGKKFITLPCLHMLTPVCSEFASGGARYCY